MNLVLQSIAIVFCCRSFNASYYQNQPSFNEFSSKTFIGLVSLASAAVLEYYFRDLLSFTEKPT